MDVGGCYYVAIQPLLSKAMGGTVRHSHRHLRDYMRGGWTMRDLLKGVWLVAILTGCIAYSDHPLTPPDKAGPDKAILGSWFVLDDRDHLFLNIGIDEKTKGLRVVMVEYGKEGEVKTSELVGHTSRLEDKTYLNLRWDRPEEPGSGYLFIKYEIAGDRLGIGVIRYDAVKDAIRSGAVQGIIKEDKDSESVRLTESSEKLGAYVVKHDAALFEELNWMNRVALPRGPSDPMKLTPSEAVSIQERPELSETVYTVGDASCGLNLTVYRSEMNRGVVTVRSNCGVSWERQLALLRAGLKKVMADDEQAGALRALSWGRLAPDGASASELSYRLALAAFESPLWDKKRGRAKKGHENNCVVEIANHAGIYREMKPLFAEFGRDITFSEAEKVLIMEARRLPFFDLLKGYGVQPRDRLPFDCQAWFLIRDSKAPTADR